MSFDKDRVHYYLIKENYNRMKLFERRNDSSNNANTSNTPSPATAVPPMPTRAQNNGGERREFNGGQRRRPNKFNTNKTDPATSITGPVSLPDPMKEEAPTPARPRNTQRSRQTGSSGQSQNNQRRGNNPQRRDSRNQRGGQNTRRDGAFQRQGPRRQVNGQQVFHTANALTWGNNSSYQFKNDPDGAKLRVIPISGVEMVGTNCTVLEYDQDIVVVDAGLGFPGETLVGVDGLVPNLSYLYDKKDKIRGLVITHGHTDHIGGIHHIIDKIGFPMIYAPKLAAGLIREKLKETPYAKQVKITEIDGDSSYYLGKFRVSHFKMTHTIPDNFGIVFDTPVGRVVTTSDYKFDSSPYKESPSDYSKLAKLGDEGVLLALDESTNAKKRGWSESETDIAKDMEDIIRGSSGRVIIGMFSTMVNRIRQVVEIADKHNKKVAVLGRSLETIVRITHGLGYIDVANSVFVPFDQINKIADDKIIILTTGSQGEANAALMRIAKGEHPKVQLRKTDTVVFSSSRIPGNETKIDYLINMITERGVRVLTNDYLTLHATGHGFQEDHKLMLRLLKPKFFMPVHGEPSMLVAHKDTAMQMGYEEQNIIIPSNGMIIEFWKDGWKIVEKIDTTPLWVEGNRVGDFDPLIVEDRKLLMDEGVIMVALKNQASGELSKENLDIHHRGFFVQSNDEFFFKKLPSAILHSVNGLADRSNDSVKAVVKRFVENELQRYYEKRPMVVVSVL